ncbi:MAG: ATP-binding protein [Thermoflexaceae bacterium]|nr:ATP-binding protein [Thermoflexaceae bacterium]
MIKSVKYVFFILTVLFFGYLFAGQIMFPPDKINMSNICVEYNGEWYMDLGDGVPEKITIPSRIDMDVGVLTTVIPDNLDQRITCLCFRSQDMKAYLDDELIYEYSTDKTRWFGDSSPESYVSIPITYNDAGKVLKLEVASDTGILYQPYLGSEFGLWAHLFKMYGGELIVAAVTLVIGVLTIIISTLYCIINKRNLDIIYLGMGVTLAAVWLITNSVFRQLFFVNVSTASDIPFLCVMIIPYPFMIYMNEVQQSRYVKLYCCIGWIIASIDIVCCVLYVFGIKQIVSTFVFVAMGCLLAIFSVFLTFILDLRKGRISEYRYVAFGLFGALVLSVIQIAVYFNRTGVFRGSYLAIGLLILLSGAVIHTISNIFSIEKDKKIALIANEAKGKFLASMSHEIRTPINAVLGMDEMIHRECRDIQIREYALDIQNAGKSLLSLINDILDISKIDSGKLEIITAEYDLSSLIHDTISMISHRAKTKELDLNLSLDENLPSRLKGDDVRIRQVLINILNNAVKYTNEGGVTLFVSGDRKEDKMILHFRVTDTGIGIKEEDLPKLFEEFSRIEEDRNRNIEGTGLGMSITVQLLKLMGSHLNVTSVYGEGSSFFFDLEQGIADETPIGNLSERIKKQEQEYTYEIAFTAPDADILAVDDNAINRKVLRQLLKDTLVRIDEADSGEECLKKIAEKKYDLIFLDHMMPGMDGIETLHSFGFVEGNKNIDTPVVALTANAVTGAKEMYLNNGFTAFLTKPIIFAKLEETIKQLLPADKLKPGNVKMEYSQIDRLNEDRRLDEKDNQEEIEQLLESLPEINLEYAYIHCNSPQDLYEIIVDFIKMTDYEADELESYAVKIHTDEEALKQYRIKVHSMKASAAMIGAVHLSGMARLLELAAINNKKDTIDNVTPVFLEEWRNYKEKLSPVTEREKRLVGNVEKIELNIDVLMEQLSMLCVAMQEMDVDRADGIVSLLKGFEYPDEYTDKMNELYTAVEALDADEVFKIAKSLS